MPRLRFHLRSFGLMMCASILGVFGSAAAAATPAIVIALSGPLTSPVDETVTVSIINYTPVVPTNVNLSISTYANGAWATYTVIKIVIPVRGAATIPVSAIKSMMPSGITTVRLSVQGYKPAAPPAYYLAPRIVPLVPVYPAGWGTWDFPGNKQV